MKKIIVKFASIICIFTVIFSTGAGVSGSLEQFMEQCGQKSQILSILPEEERGKV